jgi:hypothetical protein
VMFQAWLADPSYYESGEGYHPNNDSLLADGPYPYESSWDTWIDYDDQKVTFKYCVYCGSPDDVLLQTDVRILTQDGTVLNPGGTLHWQAQDALYYGDGGLRHFRGLSNSYSIELTFSSNLLSAPIDLLVMPEVFNHFDFFDMPGYEYYGPTYYPLGLLRPWPPRWSSSRPCRPTCAPATRARPSPRSRVGGRAPICS